MDKDDIKRYLQLLGQELHTRNTTGDILLLGGAVMLLEVGNRATTQDIDASFEGAFIMNTDSPYWWHRYTSTESFQRILAGEDPWIAIGDFLDEWRREEVQDRAELVVNPLPPDTPATHQWAAFFAAMVEELRLQDALSVPAWTADTSFILEHPWFLYPGWRLQVWQLATTPPSFKKRNIFGGDRILLRA